MAGRFDYLEAGDISEASDLLLRHKGEAYLLAGGTDLLVNIRNGKVAPRYIISLSHLPGLTEITPLPGGGVKLGALTTLSQVHAHPLIRDRYQALAEACRSVGSVQIQNVGTAAGNICNASPAADTAPPLLVFEARLNLVGPAGRRTLPIEDFFRGPGRTALDEGEILESIDLPPTPEASASCYLKLGRTRGVDLAVVGVAALTTQAREIRLAFASVAETPLRVKEAEEILSEGGLEESGIERAARAVKKAICPISDVRASGEYRTAMAAVLMKRALKEAGNRLPKGGSS